MKYEKWKINEAAKMYVQQRDKPIFYEIHCTVIVLQ